MITKLGVGKVITQLKHKGKCPNSSWNWILTKFWIKCEQVYLKNNSDFRKYYQQLKNRDNFSHMQRSMKLTKS